MSIIIDQQTKLLVQGITGREGSYHTKQMLDAGTNIVAGVTPGKGGQTVEGVPVFNTVREAVEATGANATISFAPAKFAIDGIYEAIDAGLKTIVVLAEYVPVHDMMIAYHVAREKGVTIIGPNTFGIISPGKCKAGIMDHHIFAPGNVALISRSGTNSYETAFMMKNNGIGISTCIGVGGDMIPGTAFVDLLPALEADPETKVIAMIGEIGGNEEELAAAYIKEHVTKPVVAFIAGKNAPKGKGMGHAGAIVGADGTGSAEHKEAALSAAGAAIANNMSELVELVKKAVEQAK